MEKQSSKEEFDKTIELLFNTTKDELSFFLNENPEFAIRFSEWVLESSRKNIIITKNKKRNDKEMARRRRARVYWIDFGINIFRI